jgi:tetratricopeptide (TPR) repeat protein
VCRRLDGIPLAIELAAARMPLLGIEGLRLRLNQRFNLLTGGSRAVLRRHQTLRAALDWSHELLSAAEQAVFRRLGVFAGGFTLESAQHVARDDEIDEWDVVEHLGALVDKSMVVADDDPVPRYRLLETTRLFALERLGAVAETEMVLKRHAEAMIELLDTHRRATRRRYNSFAESAQLAKEADNLRAALDWLAQARDEPEAREFDDLAIELVSLGAEALSIASGAHEAFSRLVAMRGRLSTRTPLAVAASYWTALGRHGRIAGHEESLEAGRRGAQLCAELGDVLGQFDCLITVIAIGARRGAGDSLAAYVEEAIRIAPSEPTFRIELGWARYRWLMSVGRVEEALTCELEGARIARDADMPLVEQMRLGDTVADCEMALGRLDLAERRCRDALEVLERGAGAGRYTAHVVDTLTRVLAVQGRYKEAIAMGRRALQMTRSEGFHFRLLEPLAINAALHGRLQDASWLTGHVDAIYARRGEIRWPDARDRRERLDAMLVELDGEDARQLRADGAAANMEAAFARAFGDLPQGGPF